MENNPPLNAGTSVKSWVLPPANPMQSDRLYNVTQLISPPPEETLRRPAVPFTPSLLAGTPQSSSKRKRRTQPSVSLPQELTPNPKPRKHAKQLTDPESPTRSTFAMCATPIKSKQVISPSVHTLSTEDAETSKAKPTRSRRSATPIPVYEPPSVVFTSPREVMGASPPSKPSKRKSRSKGQVKSSSIKVVPVKKEMPDIDLNAPMPPPSPTDDPILLSGPFGPSTSTPPRPHSVTEVQVGEIPTAGRNPFHGSDDLDYYDWRTNTQPDNFSSDLLSMMGFRPSDADVAPVEIPVFHLDDLPPSSDAWSNSDDDGLEARQEMVGQGEGQYTGRWRTLLVKTKQDPPSSITRARMEQWGRPVSPFPEEAKSLQLLDEEGVQVQGSLDLDKQGKNADQDEQDEIDEEEVRRISVEPEDEDYVPSQAVEFGSLAETGHNVSAVLTDTINGQSYAPISLVEIAEGSMINSTLDTMQASLTGIVEQGMVSPMNNLSLGGPSIDDSDDETDLSFVKITSADPCAAARAAAILKQHDYDCFTEITRSKRRRSAPDKMLRRGTTIAEALARKGITEGRITKGKAKKRSSIGTGVIGSQVFISGAPVTTLRNLLDEIESEISFIGTPAKRGYETSFSHRPSMGVFDLSFIDFLTSRESGSKWTKDDWKLLDACFTDERLIVSSKKSLEGDGLVDVDAINIDCVVNRYINILGGENSVKHLGMDWERDAIVQRAKVLRRKQRLGNVAPPTTPLSSIDSAVNRTPDMDIPDFTPLRGRCTLFQRTTRPTLPPPIVDKALFQDLGEDMEPAILPAPLLAPRYAHLLEEATAVGDECFSDTNPTSLSAVTPSSKESVIEERSYVKNYDQVTTPETFGARVKGFLSSYLPTLSRTAPESSQKPLNKLVQPRLPLPPPDLLDKPRAPITTPARSSLPKPKHPRDVVRLHPAPLPISKISLIPRLKPQRLVQLNPVSYPKAREPIPVLKPRSSNGSVKDLVKSFEELKEANQGEKTSKEKPAWRS